MENWIAVLVLAIIQGITEWFPISSSSHLVLASKLMGYDGGLMLNVALHFGTLMAVFVYFGKDIVNIAQEILGLNFKSKDGKMGLYLIIAALPAVIFGFLLRNIIEGASYNLILIGLGLAITSIILFIGSSNFSFFRKELDYKGALLIGIAQIFSLFRGISRSGTTIVTGLILGLKERDAVKFSYLLSIPIIFGANVLSVGNATLPREYLWASLTAFFVALGAIHFSFKYVLNDRKNLRWIALYVLILALGIGAYSLFG